MARRDATAYLHRHYVAWLLQGQWEPELSLPDGAYPTEGEWMLLTWRYAEPIERTAWADAEALVERCFTDVCEVWPLCRGEQVSVLAMAKTLSTPAMQAALWLAATNASEEMQRIGGTVGQGLLGESCHRYADLPAADQSELNHWWTARSLIGPQERREHRKRIQNYLKKGQYGHIGGYVSRVAKRSGQNPEAFWHWIPLVMESLWMQTRPSMALLTKHLSMRSLHAEGVDALCLWVRKTCAELKMATPPEDPIRRVTESIRRDCSLPYSQTNRAEGLGLTPAYFSRLFEKKTGTRFSAYLTEMRIARAQQLLQGGASLSEVAQASGFQRKSYFCEVFRKHTGLTTQQYREMLRKGDAR